MSDARRICEATVGMRDDLREQAAEGLDYVSIEVALNMADVAVMLARKVVSEANRREETLGKIEEATERLYATSQLFGNYR